MWKLLMVVGFMVLLGSVLYLAWVKVLKPLHSVSLDSDLRKGLYDIMEDKIFGIVFGIPDYNASSREEIALDRRQMVEGFSDKLFEQITRYMGNDAARKLRFYNDADPGVGAWLEKEIESFKFTIPAVDGEMLFEDDVYNAVADVYITFSRFATNHPEAVEWTAFGFMSWVNLNIDQILDERYRIFDEENKNGRP